MTRVRIEADDFFEEARQPHGQCPGATAGIQ
jgi:hypothetical protein